MWRRFGVSDTDRDAVGVAGGELQQPQVGGGLLRSLRVLHFRRRVHIGVVNLGE